MRFGCQIFRKKKHLNRKNDKHHIIFIELINIQFFAYFYIFNIFCFWQLSTKKKVNFCFWCIFGKSSWDVFPRAWNYYVIFRSYLEILKLSLFERAYLKHVVGYSNWKLEAWDHTLTCFNILTYVPSLNESHCKFTALSAEYFFFKHFLQRLAGFYLVVWSLVNVNYFVVLDVQFVILRDSRALQFAYLLSQPKPVSVQNTIKL